MRTIGRRLPGIVTAFGAVWLGGVRRGRSARRRLDLLPELRSHPALQPEDPAVDGVRRADDEPRGACDGRGIRLVDDRVWQLAQSTPVLHRAVVFYGVTPTNDDQLRTITTPILGHYAELDYLITARVLKTKQLLGDRFTYYIYPTVPGRFTPPPAVRLFPCPVVRPRRPPRRRRGWPGRERWRFCADSLCSWHSRLDEDVAPLSPAYRVTWFPPASCLRRGTGTAPVVTLRSWVPSSQASSASFARTRFGTCMGAAWTVVSTRSHLSMVCLVQTRTSGMALPDKEGGSDA
jgi:hypothetical protein